MENNIYIYIRTETHTHTYKYIALKVGIWWIYIPVTLIDDFDLMKKQKHKTGQSLPVKIPMHKFQYSIFLQ